MLKRFNQMSPRSVLAWTITASFVPFVILTLFPTQFHYVMDRALYLLFHNITEFFSIMVSLSIFGVGWYTYDQSKDRHALFLSATFLVVGLLDFMHGLSNAAMPAFVTPNSSNKSTQFWIAARLFSASAFLVSAFVYPGKQPGRLPKGFSSRSLLITVALAISLLVFTGITFFPSYTPDTYIPGAGLTPFKIYSEYVTIFLLCISAGAYWMRMTRTRDRLFMYYVAAFVLCIFSELIFAGYKNVFDTYNVLGHLYKIAAFCLIYKGIFVASVKSPYAELADTNKRLDAEVTERKQAEAALLRTKEGLEELVNERIAEVRNVNNRLQVELTKHKQAEEALSRAHDDLERRVQERTAELKQEIRGREQAQRQLIRAQKLEALGTLAGGIAHDFNNVLASIIGFTEMALEDIGRDSPGHKSLRLVLKGAHRGRDLAKQILLFSRQSEQNKEPLALTQIIDEALEMLRPVLPSTIEIVCKYPIYDERILADPVQMHQVSVNLCTNAAHAMREKGGMLEIAISRAVVVEGTRAPVAKMMPGEYVVLKVTDTGCGMEPQTLERIFDPFFTTKREGEGTGLGLAISYGIVKNHGGYVAVESEPGKGSTFQVYLPRVKTTEVIQDKEAPSATGGSERIMIVDDEDALVELNQQRLTRLGYDVVTTTSSMDALHVFQERPDEFDLVITDQTMPNLTGTDLATELLKVRSDIPIILCTGRSNAVSPDSTKRAGIKAVLMKPLGKRELAEAVRRALDANRKK